MALLKINEPPLQLVADAAGRIIRLLGDADEAGQKPYAAVLYAFDRSAGICSARAVAEGQNTERQHQNSLKHAEINVLDTAAPLLWEHKQTPWGKRTQDFFLFVNTRSCPKCTAAIADCQIFDVWFFWDNRYAVEISEAILQGYRRILEKQVGHNARRYVFTELQSDFRDTIRELTIKRSEGHT